MSAEDRIQEVQFQPGAEKTVFVCGISANNLTVEQRKYIAELFERNAWPDIEAAHIAAFSDRDISVDGDLTVHELHRLHAALIGMPGAES